MKVSVSETTNNREVDVLRAISALPDDHPGRAHLVQRQDDFTVNGPNGTHDCLVLELLGPSVPDVIDTFYRDGRLPAILAKSTIRQVLLGLDFLAQHDIGHGGQLTALMEALLLTRPCSDLHTGNLAFAISNLASLDEQQFFERFGSPETASVSRVDGESWTAMCHHT